MQKQFQREYTPNKLIIKALYAKGIRVQFYLLPLLMIPIYAGIFYAVLGWLNVQTFRVKRCLILASILSVIELVSYLIVFSLQLDGVVNTIISVCAFVFVIRKLLILKMWQAIAIPIGVTIFGYLILSVLFMVFFQFS